LRVKIGSAVSSVALFKYSISLDYTRSSATAERARI